MPTVIEMPGYFTSLPRDYYFSPAIYDQELERVFNRQWLMVGHVSSLKSIGDYFVKQIGPESMIFVRDKDNRVRAFFNVCRHRGFRLCKSGESGNAKRFTCPYHAWTFNIDGSVFAVPGAQDGRDFNFADWGLHEAWCDIQYGFIFACLGKERPAPLADLLAPTCDDAAIRSIEPERLKLAHRQAYVVNANWKAVLDNNMECYHCPVAHPSLSIACDYKGFYADTRGAHFPIREGMKTFSIDGDWVCSKPLGTPQAERFSAGFLLVPLFCGPVFFADHAVALELTPLSIDKTQLVSEWYVHEDAVEAVDYNRERLIKVFDVTNREDGELAERNYEGMKSMRFVPGPNNARREDGIKLALDRYLAMMDAP